MLNLYEARIEKTQMYSNLFVRMVLSEYLRTGIEMLKISKSEYGKPYLVDYPNVHFNVTHAKGLIVCALSDQPIGIDVEKIKRLKRLRGAIAKRYFTETEQGYVFSEVNSQEERFIEIWTKKEAYVKWTGKGMKIPFNSFDVLTMEWPCLVCKPFKQSVLSICSVYKIDNCNLNKIQEIKL